MHLTLKKEATRPPGFDQLSYERVRGVDYQTWPDRATSLLPGRAASGVSRDNLDENASHLDCRAALWRLRLAKTSSSTSDAPK